MSANFTKLQQQLVYPQMEGMPFLKAMLPATGKQNHSAHQRYLVNEVYTLQTVSGHFKNYLPYADIQKSGPPLPPPPSPAKSNI